MRAIGMRRNRLTTQQGLLPMADGNDLKAHASTYTGFIGLVKFTMVAVALIAAFVIFMITK